MITYTSVLDMLDWVDFIIGGQFLDEEIIKMNIDVRKLRVEDRYSPVILCQNRAVPGNRLKQTNFCWKWLVLVPINTKIFCHGFRACEPRFLGHALFCYSDFCISAQEGPRDFSDTAKCSQWPHLYTTYEAT